MPDENEIRSRMYPEVQGMFFAAATLMMAMDKPDMTIQRLRVSGAAATFRGQVRSLRGWITQAMEILPADALTAEERRFLTAWYAEMDRAAANRAAEPVQQNV